jgi:hypothetical protein
MSAANKFLILLALLMTVTAHADEADGAPRSAGNCVKSGLERSLSKRIAHRVKHFGSGVKTAAVAGVMGGISTPLIKPVMDHYNAIFNHIKSEAMDQLPVRKDLADALDKNEELQKEAEALDFEKLPDFIQRIAQWKDLEIRFRENHKQIRDIRSKLTDKTRGVEAAELLTPLQVQAARQTFLTSLTQLRDDSSTMAMITKAKGLANLKALNLLSDPVKNDEDPEIEAINEVLDQVASQPKYFQIFVHEFIAAQKLSDTAPTPPIKPAILSNGAHN